MDRPRSYQIGRFDVHGMPLHVEAAEPILFEAVDRILAPFGARRTQSEPFVLRLCRGSAAALCNGLPCLWQGMLPSGYDARYMADQSRRRLELVNVAIAELDLSTRQAQITLLSQDVRCIAGGCLTPLLTEMMRTVGWHIIHAACLRRRGDQRAGTAPVRSKWPGQNDHRPRPFARDAAAAGRRCRLLSRRRQELAGLRFAQTL